MRCLIAILLMLPSVLTGQVIAPKHLDMEPPDAYFSGSHYYEGGLQHSMISVNNVGSATWGLTTTQQATGTNSIRLFVPGDPGAVQDPNVFSRREWDMAEWAQNETYWYSFHIRFGPGHENPQWYGRVLSQVKVPSSYGFEYAIYNSTAGASSAIPLSVRYFERTGPSQGEVILDSGEVSTGFTFARDTWYYVKVQFRTSTTAGDAFYNLWVDDTLRFSRTNLTVYGQRNAGNPREVRVGMYSRREQIDGEIFIDNFKFGLNEADVAEEVTDPGDPPDPPDPPVDDGEFDSEAFASILKGYLHVRAETVVTSTGENGVVNVTQGDPAPLSAADITGPAVHFSTNGYVYAREFGLNKARKRVFWNAGVTNTLDFYLNIDTQRYDVWLTPTNGAAILLARNFSYTNLFTEVTHLGWSTNMTADLISATNIIRRATATTVTAGAEGGE